MVIVQCPGCAARYRVPEKLRGKTVKCKKCGKPFRIAPAPPEPEPELEEDLLGALADGESVAPSVAPPATPSPPAADAAPPAFPGREWSTTAPGPVEESAPTGFTPYLRDVGKSLLFFTRGGDLVTFLIVVFFVFAQIPVAFAPCIGVLGVFIIQGWYMAFRLNVVLGAAGGEQNLPDLALGDVWEGIILPLVKYLASWVAALVPFAIGLVYLAAFGQMGWWEALGHFTTALKGDFVAAFDEDQGGGALLGAILLVAMVIWPMMVLVVAVGGVSGLVRFDLMLVTIVRTLLAYVLVVVLAYAGVVGPALLTAGALAVASERGEGVGLIGVVLGVGAVFIVLQVYANIFTMRVIGLYYHHFKKRFAWSWG